MMPFSMARPDRRGFLRVVASIATTAFLPMPTRADSPGLRLETRPAAGGTRFRVRLDCCRDIETVQVFALGERKPLLASYSASDGLFQPMTGMVTPGRDQHLMALARLSDGTMIHARAFVSATTN